jgi:hypothetical protein
MSERQNAISRGVKGDEKLEVIACKAIKDIPIGEQLTINYGHCSNHHLLQKYGFTVPENPHAKVPFYPEINTEKQIVSQEFELKHKLYQKLDIPMFNSTYYFYQKKFDINMLVAYRIAMLTSEMVDTLTFDHIWNTEDFKAPLSKTHEELVLN